MSEDNNRHKMAHEELPEEHTDPLISSLHHVIRFMVKIVAILMVAIIIFSVGDVIYIFYQRLQVPPLFLLDVKDIFLLFGSVMVVLIAIEIFINIRLYLGTDVVPIQLVIATALMAISRKVIVLDLEKVTPNYIFGISTVIISLGITYWLVSHKTNKVNSSIKVDKSL